MTKKIMKYLVSGFEYEKQKAVEKEKNKSDENKANYRRWWKEEETKREALEKEVEALKAELADAKTVIAGYKETMERGLGIREDVRLAELQLEKGVNIDA